MSNSFYHKDLTDTQWSRIKFVFEESAKVGRPPLNPRTVFNGILWLLKSEARWRDLPARYGNWNSIYHKFRQWCESGLFELLLHLVNAATAYSTLLEMDSTIRDYLAQRGSVVCIPDKSTFKTKHTFDAELYKQRNKVERFFQRIKNFRHIATRFDKLALCFKNFVLLAACVIHF